MQDFSNNSNLDKDQLNDLTQSPLGEPFVDSKENTTTVKDFLENPEEVESGNESSEDNNNTCKNEPANYSGTEKIFKKIKEIFQKIYEIRSELPVIMISSFLIISLFNMLGIKTPASGIDFINSIDITASIRSLIILFVLMLVLRLYFYDRKFTFLFLLISTFGFTFWLIYELPRNLYLTVGCIIAVGAITYISFKEENNSFIFAPINRNASFLLITILFLITSFLLSMASIYRHKAFGSSNFDFGIFAQVFEYLKSTGIPFSTSERDKLLSHFAVHFSPIYYTILPGYLIFSAPEYLLVMQAILICSAVFPLYLLCRHYNLNTTISVLVSVTYLVYPGTVSPAMFDFHENKFLTVLILWMIYFFEKKKTAPMYIFMLLTLMVKEDAAIYIFALGLFFILVRKAFLHGSIITVSSIMYFLIVVSLMTKYGEGVMDYRFAAYLQKGEDGLLTIVKNIALNPAYFIKNIFIKEKLDFILYMFTPVVFIPFVSKETKRLVLLIPMVLINLMSLYPYQYQIGFQYTYGVAAILFFMFLINLKDFKNKYISIICIISVFASLTLAITYIEENVSYYHKAYMTNQQKYSQTEIVLAKIPASASVTATTYMVPHLSKVKVLYMYPSSNQTEYFVYDIRDIKIKDKIVQMLKENGYSMIDSGGLAQVYKKQ